MLPALNAIIPPLALDGPVPTIRSFGSNPLKLEDLLNYKSLTPEMVMLLECAMKATSSTSHLRRYRLRQDDASEHALQLHLE